jgi:hypothetical protein
MVPSINMLVFGDSGIGKTVFGGGAGGADLIISTEKDKGVSARRHGGKGKIIVCPTYEEFLAAKQAWEDGVYGDPEWTMFDSLTSIQEKLIQWILEREFGKAGGAEGSRKLDVLQIQDHLEYQNATRRLVSELCDTPRNVLFTAQSMNVETDGGDERVLPFLDGKKGGVSNYVCGMMTCVGYMKLINVPATTAAGKETEIAHRRIYWQPKPPYFAKDWTDSLGRYTTDVTLAQAAQKITDSNTEKIIIPHSKSTTNRPASRRRSRLA